MSKKQLIELVAHELKSSKTDASVSVEAVLTSIKEIIKKNGLLRLIGFGSFRVKKRAAKVIRNPQTGKQIKVGPRNHLSFSASDAIKEAIN